MNVHTVVDSETPTRHIGMDGVLQGEGGLAHRAHRGLGQTLCYTVIATHTNLPVN